MRGLLTELKVFMFIVFVLFGSICGGNNAEFPSDQETTIKRLTDDVRPSSYIIRLNSTLYPVFISNGEVLIDLTVKSSVENITLHARKLDVISVMILEKHRFKKYKIDRSDPSNVLDIVRKAGDIKSFTIENDLLEIPARSGRELGGGYFKAGDYLLYARFNAMIGDLAQGYGLYRDSYEDGNRTRWLMSTVFETSRARTAFPCFDEPSFKSRFKIILARTRDQVALANMPSLKSYPMDGTDLMWEEFEETPPMSTYLVAFFVGDFTSWTGRRGDVTVWTSPATDRTLVDWSLEEGFKALYHMQNIFDLDNPLPKTDLLAVPHFDVAGAVENWGLITIREDILTLSNNTGQALRRRMTILAHELAHTWFGNSVTPSWWDEVWWSEGFASYYATRIVQKLKPDWDVIGWDSVDFLYETWKLDSKPEVRYLAKPVEVYDELNFGNLVYCKGFLVARFAGWITQRAATFDKAVGKYLKENQFGLFNDRKMWRTIEEAVLAKNNSIMDLPAPLATIMRSWTHQAGMPLIKVLRSSSGQIVITQERYAEKMKTGNETKSRKIGEKWWIPIEIEFGDHSEVNLVLETSGLSNESQYSKEKRAALPTSDKQTYWMNPLDEKLEIRDHDHDHSSWVLINLNVPVPCRVMYDEWNLQMLTRNDYKRFTTVGLAQMIADASALAMHGEYRLPLALQMIRDVLQTTDSFAVWRIGLVNLHKFEYQLKGTDAYQLYQQFIQQLIGWQFGRLKILSESRDRGMTMNDELLRFEVAETACNARLRACLIEANNIFRKWIDSSLSKPDSQNFIRHDVRTTVYCTAIELGGEREWQFLWDQLQGKRSNIDQEERRRILDALACSKNQQLLKRYLESSLQTNTTDNLRNFKERRAVFYSVLKNVDAVDLLMDFMHENKDEMKRVYSRSEKRFNWKRAVALLATFVSTNHITKLEKLTRNTQILNKARKMIMWRSENSKEAAEWLRRVVV